MLWIIVLLLIYIVQLLTVLIAEFRHPAKAVAWMLILFVMPLVGFVLYYFLAKDFQHRRAVRKRGLQRKELPPGVQRAQLLIKDAGQLRNTRFVQENRLFQLLASREAVPITGCNRTVVLENGQETYPAIFRALREARHHVHVEYYTVMDDGIGGEFRDLLIQKAQAGVTVRLIYDGVGSYELPESYIRALQQGGVQTACFLRPRLALFEKRMNYRNHRKIVVVDGRIGFLGGINIGDDYLGQNPVYGFWRDTHLQVEGDAVYLLQDIFMRDWYFTTGEQLFTEQSRAVAGQTGEQAGEQVGAAGEQAGESSGEQVGAAGEQTGVQATKQQYYPAHACAYKEAVQIVSSGPDRRSDAILECLFSAMSVAHDRIYMTTPYFIPDQSLLMALKTAARSGVDVRLMLPGHSDSRVVMAASLSYVKELLQAGVRVYRYQKGFVHAKVVIIDDMLASVGTSNLDMRSFFFNFELVALLFEQERIEELQRHFMHDLENSQELVLERFEARPRWRKAGEVVARLLSPLL